MRFERSIWAAFIVAAIALALQKPAPAPPPDVPVPVVTPDVKATAVVYVYEKDQSAIPVGVQTALNRLNRERKIPATLYEVDNTDGDRQVPEQYRIPKAEAERVGLPALVVMAGGAALKTVKAPATEQAVMEAVP